MSEANPRAPCYSLKRYEKADRLWACAETAVDRAFLTLSDRPAADLGVLSLARPLHYDVENTMLQVRPQPLPELAGSEMRLRVPYGKPGPSYTRILTDEIVHSASALWERRAEAAELVAAVAAKVEHYRDPAFQNGRYPMIGAIGVGPGSWANGLEVVLDLDVLGLGMTWNTLRLNARSGSDLHDRLIESTNEHLSAFNIMGRLRADRCRGHIEETAIRVLDVAGMALETALDHLTRSRQLAFVADGRYQCDLHWSDGVLKCQVTSLESGWNLVNDALWLKDAVFPQVIGDSLVGRRLGTVFSSDVLPLDAVITWAEDRPDAVKVLWLAIPTARLPDPDDLVGLIVRKRLTRWPSACGPTGAAGSLD